EDERGGRLVGRGLQRDLFVVLRGDLDTLVGGGQVRDDRLQQRADAVVAVGRAAQQRNHRAIVDAGVKLANGLFVADLFLVEIAHQQLFVVLGDRFDQGTAVGFALFGEIVWHGLATVAAFGVGVDHQRLVGKEVDDAAKALGG